MKNEIEKIENEIINFQSENVLTELLENYNNNNNYILFDLDMMRECFELNKLLMKFDNDLLFVFEVSIEKNDNDLAINMVLGEKNVTIEYFANKINSTANLIFEYLQNYAKKQLHNFIIIMITNNLIHFEFNEQLILFKINPDNYEKISLN